MDDALTVGLRWRHKACGHRRPRGGASLRRTATLPWTTGDRPVTTTADRPTYAATPRRTCARWSAATTPSCARTSGARSRRWRSAAAGRWWCSAPAGASRRSTSWPPCCCAPRAPGPTVIVSPLLALMRNQIAAAERAGIRAVTINSTNIESWEPIHDAIRAGEVDVLLVSPERLNNPGLPRRGAAPAGRDLRAARGRRGALHLRLGPRLPARLPPDPHPARRPARGHPRAGDDRHRQRAGDRRRRRAARHERRAGAARAPSTASRCGSAWSGSRPPSSGWPGWPTTSPSSPGSASSTA